MLKNMRSKGYRPWLAALIGLGLSLGVALGCGVEFPHRLLEQRGRSLEELPDNRFTLETKRLGAAIPGLALAGQGDVIADPSMPQEPQSDEDDGLPYRRYLYERDAVEQAQLPAPQWTRIKQLRLLRDARKAEADGMDLPAELRLYTAGAVAFDQYDYALASGYFQRVLDLPAEERRLRSTWAAYSLGRAQAALGTPEGRPAETVPLGAAKRGQAMQAATGAARQAFQLSRKLAAEGFSDPLELGIASLGEEARLAKHEGDWNSAIRLYASQYAQGSYSGHVSLRFVSAELAAMPEPQLAPLLQQPEVRQLLTLRLLSRMDVDQFGSLPTESEKTLARLLTRDGSFDPRYAAHLAALSYKHGRYDDAKTFLRQAHDSGLAWWLRAKLALRDGDQVGAVAAYARAAKAFPAQESWGTQVKRVGEDEDYYHSYEQVSPHFRVTGESALLALRRGDYVEAFDTLYQSGGRYWQDSAELAERVLTLEELKAYVDAKVPALAESELQAASGPQAMWPMSAELPLPARLRELLGRRLLRAGYWREAPAYFAREPLRQAAAGYAQARIQAESRWTRLGQAEAYYRAGRLARLQGMELLGSEVGPDYKVYEGNYFRNEARPEPGPWLSMDEAARQARHLAKPDLRYHYRYLAVSLAEQAADRLPTSSQAFAAVLCKGFVWNEHQDYATAQRLYRRYVAQGPQVPWGFGLNCPEPDFAGASKRAWAERFQHLAQRKFGLLGAASLLALTAGLWLRRRRRLPPAPSARAKVAAAE